MLSYRETGAVLAAFVLAATVLAGCKATYEVNVRNRADQPIEAQVRAGRPTRSSSILESQRIGPGDRAWLGPARAGPLKNVYLWVDFDGNVDAPATLKLRRGMTAVNVVRTDEGAQGSIRLEAVRPE